MRPQQEIDKKFLYGENRQLRLQLKQSRQLLKIHKESVYQLSQPHVTSSHVISTLLSLLTKLQSNSEVQALNEKILELESQKMVLEKIVQQTDNDEKETYHLLAEEYNKIKSDNDKLEKQLHKFYEKIGEVDYLSGLVTKFKEVILPTEQAEAFKKEQDQLLEFITMQKEAIRKLTEQKNKLLRINIHMKQSVQKHKDQVRNMTLLLSNPDSFLNTSTLPPPADHNPNILDQLNQQCNSTAMPINSTTLLGNTTLLNTTNARNLNTTMNFIKMQRKIIKQEQESQLQGSAEDSDDEYDCPEINILFPDKVEKIKKDKEIIKIPYLNMLKIRESMAKRDSKLRKQLQNENKHISVVDKIIKIQTELEITRKQLTNQTLKFRNMSQELKESLRLNDELTHRCQLLTEANEKLRLNYHNIYKDYQYTRLVTTRVERAIGSKLDLRQHEMQQIFNRANEIELEAKIEGVESMLAKMLGKRGLRARRQSF